MPSTPTALLSDLFDLIGVQPTIALCKRYGGERIHIPESVPPDHWLVEAVGPAAAKILAFHYGRCTIDLPKGIRQINEARDQRILQASASANSSDLVREFGLTRRRILQILASARAEPEESL